MFSSCFLSLKLSPLKYSEPPSWDSAVNNGQTRIASSELDLTKESFRLRQFRTINHYTQTFECTAITGREFTKYDPTEQLENLLINALVKEVVLLTTIMCVLSAPMAFAERILD